MTKGGLIKVSSIIEDRYNDIVCYQRFCCKTELAVIKKLKETMLQPLYIYQNNRWHIVSHITDGGHALAVVPPAWLPIKRTEIKLKLL